MTLDQALQLHKGDIVTSPHTAIQREPVVVTEVWINPTRTIVMMRVHKVAKDRWIHAPVNDAAAVNLLPDAPHAIPEIFAGKNGVAQIQLARRRCQFLMDWLRSTTMKLIPVIDFPGGEPVIGDVVGRGNSSGPRQFGQRNGNVREIPHENHVGLEFIA